MACTLSDDGTMDTVFTCDDCGEEIRYSSEDLRSEDEDVAELEAQATEEHADECELPAEQRKRIEAIVAVDVDADDPCARFSAACGLYWYCSDFHGGQWSDEYSVLSELEYLPGALERGVEPGSTDEDVYNALERKELEPRAVLRWVEYQCKYGVDGSEERS